MNKTNKTMYWILWAIALVGINIPGIGLAIWSTFAGTEDAKFLWIAIAIVIFLLLNMGIIQMFIAIKQEKYRFFGIGLLVTAVQFIAMMILGGEFTGDIYLLLGAIAISIILMVLQRKKSSI